MLACASNESRLITLGYPKDYTDVDPYNYKLTADDDFIADAQRRAERRIPPFAGKSLITAYAALYEVTPDWYPFYGPRQGALILGVIWDLWV